MILEQNDKRHSKGLYYKLLMIFLMTLSLLGLVMLSSCEKKEPLWELPPPGDEVIAQAAMGETYDNTVFFKFKTSNKIERNVNVFHLAFQSSHQGFSVRVNGGKNVQVFNTHSINFDELLTASASTQWGYDSPDGNPDSTAVGNWLVSSETRQSKLEVYIIDLGTGATPKYRKFQLLQVSDTSYSIRHANLDNSDEKQTTFAKSAIATFTYFDFTTNTTVSFEPAPHEYDIVFTKYKHIFFQEEGILHYSVNGALLNPVHTMAAKTDSSNFALVNYSSTTSAVFTQAINTIGYDWKVYDLDNNKYSVIPKIYIVKDADETLWKLEFIDFYNDAGIKGFPKFRYQRL
jgi:hypothetical protein